MISTLNPMVEMTPTRTSPNKSVHFKVAQPKLEHMAPADPTLKHVQNQLKQTKMNSLADLQKLKSRVHLLNQEELKMQQKVKQTKRLN